MPTRETQSLQRDHHLIREKNPRYLKRFREEEYLGGWASLGRLHMELKPGHGRMRQHWSEDEDGALGEQPSNLSLAVCVGGTGRVDLG